MRYHTYMKSFFSRLGRAVRSRSQKVWVWYRAQSAWAQAAIGIGLAVVIIGGAALAQKGSTDDSGNQARTVTLSTVNELSGGTDGAGVLGTVQSVSEANLSTQTGGTVVRVGATLGQTVPAGYALVEFDNASQRASVLQAEGAYDAAVAARNATSLPDTKTSARNAYQSAFTSIDNVLETDVDQFFGSPTPTGPRLLISAPDLPYGELSRQRQDLDTMMTTWRANQASASTADPLTLLTEAQTDTDKVSAFLTTLATEANDLNSNATPAQISALAAARASVNGVESSLSAARSSYRSTSSGATAGADASVKQALGSLQAAQAQLEKTIVRAPIGGTVNFLSPKVGDYVNALTHVATVAQNGALEIVLHISDDDRATLAVGSKVTVGSGHTGVVTEIAPALDLVTKQIEVHVAVTDTKDASDLVNGQSVRVTLPNMAAAKVSAQATSTPALLPLAAVKLTADTRVVFTVGDDGRLKAMPVEIGQVIGDRIQVLTPLPVDLHIVTDARGLSDGEKVEVAS